MTNCSATFAPPSCKQIVGHHARERFRFAIVAFPHQLLIKE
jgi:hypothetical protein